MSLILGVLVARMLVGKKFNIRRSIRIIKKESKVLIGLLTEIGQVSYKAINWVNDFFEKFGKKKNEKIVVVPTEGFREIDNYNIIDFKTEVDLRKAK